MAATRWTGRGKSLLYCYSRGAGSGRIAIARRGGAPVELRRASMARPAWPSAWRPADVRCLLSSRLGNGIACLAGGEAINLFLSLCSFVLITRLLGVERYGVWTTVIDGLSIMLALAAFGLPLAAVQAI